MTHLVGVASIESSFSQVMMSKTQLRNLIIISIDYRNMNYRNVNTTVRSLRIYI